MYLQNVSYDVWPIHFDRICTICADIDAESVWFKKFPKFGFDIFSPAVQM